MTLSCVIRYEIGAFQRDAFKVYPRPGAASSCVAEATGSAAARPMSVRVRPR